MDSLIPKPLPKCLPSIEPWAALCVQVAGGRAPRVAQNLLSRFTCGSRTWHPLRPRGLMSPRGLSPRSLHQPGLPITLPRAHRPRSDPAPSCLPSASGHPTSPKPVATTQCVTAGKSCRFLDTGKQVLGCL